MQGNNSENQLKYCGKIPEFSSKQRKNNFVLSADIDYMSFLIVWHHGMICMFGSGALWLSLHSIEKYLKAWLLKNNEKENIGKYKHNLNLLWKECKKNLSKVFDFYLSVI